MDIVHDPITAGMVKTLVDSPVAPPNPIGPLYTNYFFTSGTWTAPHDGVIVIRAVGGGGGGCGGGNWTYSTNSTGYAGSSGAMGQKIIAVENGAVVTVTIGGGGAGGAGSQYSTTPGGSGGGTTVVVNGITYSVGGGALGGTVLPSRAVASGNWDISAPSRIPTSKGTQGMGVDLFGMGGDATPHVLPNNISEATGAIAPEISRLWGIESNGRISITNTPIPFTGGAHVNNGGTIYSYGGALGGGGAAGNHTTANGSTGMYGGSGGSGYAFLQFYVSSGSIS